MIRDHDISFRNHLGQNYLLMICASNLGNRSIEYDKPGRLMYKLIKAIIEKAKNNNSLQTILNLKDNANRTAIDLINSNTILSEKDKQDICNLLDNPNQ